MYISKASDFSNEWKVFMCNINSAAMSFYFFVVGADPTLRILPGSKVSLSIGESVFFTCKIEGIVDVQNPDFKWFDATGEQVSWTSAA